LASDLLHCLVSFSIHLQEGLLIKRLRIVYRNFTLDSAVNLSNRKLASLPNSSSFVIDSSSVDRTLHAALDKYAFFAVTGSLTTLNELTKMLKKDNERRQIEFDADAIVPSRKLNVSSIVYSVVHQNSRLSVLLAVSTPCVSQS
jgi:hypothetical protein